MSRDKVGCEPLKLGRNRVRRPFRGGRLLDEWQGNEVVEDGYRAEEWVGSMVEAVNPDGIVYEGLSRVVVDGKEGRLLRELIQENPELMLGAGHVCKYGVNMGILIKVLDSCSRLLLQVHPTRDFAQKYCDSVYGKTEAWHVLGTRSIDGEEPYVLLGFKEGITREKWMQLFEAQDIEGMIACLHKFYVKAGDTFFVEGGMPHAAGSGVFFLELQEPTDITFRTERKNLVGDLLTDQQLHQGIGFERMFDCFAYKGYKREEILEKCYLEKQREWIISPERCDYFSAKELEIKGSLRDIQKGTFSVVIVIAGNGVVKWGERMLEVTQGDEIFLVAEVGEVVWEQMGEGGLRLIQCFPPK